jgi:hypothetical protein
VRSPGRAKARRDVQRRRPPTGRRPAPPQRPAPSGVGRFGPEVQLDHAAGSIGGRGSCTRGPTAPSILASGTTIEVTFRRPAPCSIQLRTPSCSRIAFWRPTGKCRPRRGLTGAATASRINVHLDRPHCVSSVARTLARASIGAIHAASSGCSPRQSRAGWRRSR